MDGGHTKDMRACDIDDDMIRDSDGRRGKIRIADPNLRGIKAKIKKIF